MTRIFYLPNRFCRVMQTSFGRCLLGCIITSVGLWGLGHAAQAEDKTWLPGTEIVGRTPQSYTEEQKTWIVERKLQLDRAYADLNKAQQTVAAYEKAITPLRAIYEKDRQLFGGQHVETLDSLDRLIAIHYWATRFKEAIALQDEAIAIALKLFGPDDYRTKEEEMQRARFKILIEREPQIASKFLDANRTLSALQKNTFPGTALEKLKASQDVFAAYSAVLGDDNDYLPIVALTLARLQTELGLLEDGNQLAKQVDAVASYKFGSLNPLVASIRMLQARAALKDSRYEAAERLARQALEIYDRIEGYPCAERAWARYWHAVTLIKLADLGNAESDLKAMLADVSRLSNESPEKTLLQCAASLQTAAINRARKQFALSLAGLDQAEQALARYRTTNANLPVIWKIEIELDRVQTLQLQGDAQPAMAKLLELMQSIPKGSEFDHWRMRGLQMWAILSTKVKDFKDAWQFAQEALETTYQAYGANHRVTHSRFKDLRFIGVEYSNQLMMESKFKEALDIAGVVDQAAKRIYNEDDPERVLASSWSSDFSHLAKLSPEQRNRTRRIVELGTEIGDLRKNAERPNDPEAEIISAPGQQSEANKRVLTQVMERQQEIVRIRRELFPADSLGTAQTLVSLSISQLLDGRTADAQTTVLAAAEIVERRAGVDNRLPVYADILHIYAICLSNQSQVSRAIPLLQRSRILTLAARGPNSLQYKNVLERLASLLDKESNYAASESVYRELVLDAERNGLADSPVHISRVSKLAIALFWQSKHAEAAQLFERSIAYHLADKSGNLRTAADHRFRLAECYWKTDRADEALATVKLHNDFYRELSTQAKDDQALAFDLAMGKCLEGRVCASLPKPAEAEQALESAIEMFRQLNKLDTNDAQLALNEIERLWIRRSVELRKKGDWEACVPIAQKMLQQRRERFGKEHPYVMDVELGLETDQRLIRLDKASRQEILSAMASIASIQATQDDAVAAKRLKELRQRIDSLLNGPNSVSNPTYEIEFNLRLKLMEYAAAVELCQQWKEAYAQQYRAKPYTIHALWQQRLGIARFRQGRFEEASQSFQSAIDILAPLTSLGIATQSIQNEIQLYHGRSLLRSGKRPEADAIIRAIHADMARQNNLAAALQALDHLCDLLQEQQDWAELHRRAKELAQLGLRVEGSKSPTERLAMGYLARAQMQLGLFDEAARTLDRLAALDLKAGLKSVALTTILLRGRLAYLRKDFEEAEKLLKTATDGAPKDLPQNEKLDHLLMAAHIARDAGDTRLWRDHLTKIQSLVALSHGTNMDMAPVDLEQARYELVDDKLTAAKQLLAQACDRGWQELDYALRTGTEAGQLATQNRLRERLDLWLSCPQSLVSAEEAYQQVLRWKGVVFHRQKQLVQQLREPKFAKLANQLRFTTGQLTSLWLTVPAEKDLPLWQGRVSLLRAEREAIEQQLVRMGDAIDPTPPTLQQILDALSDDVAVVDFVRYMHTQADPKTNSYQVAPRYTMFVLRKGQPLQRFDAGDAMRIDELVENWRELRNWSKVGDDKFEKLQIQAFEAGQSLYSKIWTPMKRALANVETVLVSPDGKLAAMPYAALIDEEGDYLLVKYALATVPFVSSIPEIVHARKKMANGKQSLYMVADVAFGGQLGKDASASASGNPSKPAGNSPQERAHLLGFFKPLAAGKLELPAVGKLFKGGFADGQVVSSFARAATESAFMRHAPDARWLYLSTHGYYMPDMWSSTRWNDRLANAAADDQKQLRPVHELFPPKMLSGITFAGVNDATSAFAQDGLLSSWELTTLPLNAELVVVSACQTAEGDSMDGQGVASFQQATHLSGCRSTLSTLWSVEDTQSRLLTARVLWNLWDPKRRMSKVAALREAQVWFLMAGNKGKEVKWDNFDPATLTHQSEALPPFFRIATCWTGFVLSGDWE